MIGLAALVLVVGLGVAKLLVAMSRGRSNVGFLIVLLFVALFISARLMKPPLWTAAGSQYLSWLKESHRGLRSMVIDGRRPGFGELALAAGIFGISWRLCGLSHGSLSLNCLYRSVWPRYGSKWTRQLSSVLPFWS